ncbi:MAG: iron sulfur domain-containing, CDGSH-type [Piptocephalis tieghemiana]|nr:MAG: iron sulfur domain-containing, CDGSH-type [Piptocephalis tieghemiana]
MQFGPCNLRNLVPGKKMRWCTCGLSKKQPWCDDRHKGTSFRPLIWTVPTMDVTGKGRASICACKYTSNPPYVIRNLGWG